jgi:hypothetical protein
MTTEAAEDSARPSSVAAQYEILRMSALGEALLPKRADALSAPWHVGMGTDADRPERLRESDSCTAAQLTSTLQT